MRDTFLPFAPPDITQEEIQAVIEALNSKWITTGPKAREFEEAFAEYVNAPAALALNSCTAGLHLALATLEIGPGDEVITTPMTFCSSVNVIEHVGATPVLVDVEPDTLLIDPALIERAVTSRTKAILPVHYAGQPANMGSILEIANEHGLRIIEDAAHALPAYYEDTMIGSIGDFTAFSFYATKNLTTAEGGILTGEPQDIEVARRLALHGMNKNAWNRYGEGGSWNYEVVAPGFKYNMPDIQAALGLVQLKRLESMQAHRKMLVNQYNDALKNTATLQLPVEKSNVDHAWHLYTVRLNLEQLALDRAGYIEELSKRNIGASVHFIPIHLHPYYSEKYGWQPEDFPVAFREFLRLVSLPLSSALTQKDIEDVTIAVLEINEQYKN